MFETKITLAQARKRNVQPQNLIVSLHLHNQNSRHPYLHQQYLVKLIMLLLRLKVFCAFVVRLVEIYGSELINKLFKMSWLVAFRLNLREWFNLYRLKSLFLAPDASSDNLPIGISPKLAIISAP